MYKLGCGLDIGTMNIVAARETIEGEVGTRRIRDCFLDLDKEAKKSLKLSKVDFVEQDDKLVVLGDSALNMANLFKREVRRPLSRGVIAAGEMDAQKILAILIKNVLGEPNRGSTGPDHCYYSVPAEPIDLPGQSIVYHTEVFRKILHDLGWSPHPANEAMAIIFSQCAAESFSGLSVSFGSGMTNVALAYQATKGMEFSLARGGDFIDQNAGMAVGKTAAQICAVKEKGIDLLDPKTREQEAIVFYVRDSIAYCLKNIASQFSKVSGTIELPDAVPFVVSGGTTKAAHFMDVFKEEFAKFQDKFPIQISEVRQATDPLTAVAEGLLVLAQQED